MASEVCSARQCLLTIRWRTADDEQGEKKGEASHHRKDTSVDSVAMHVLFDLDGTLTDPKVGITRSIVYALTRMGRSSVEPDSLCWCIGPPLRHSLATLLETESGEVVEQALAHYRERFSEIGLFENEVYTGIPEALASLEGHTLHVATSKPQVYARRILERFELTPFFASVVGSELDGTRESKAEVIGHVLHCAGATAQSAVMVGDRIHDILGARHHGMPSVGVLYGYGSAVELELASILCDTPAELSDVLKGGFSDRQASAVRPKISMSKREPSDRTPSL